MTELRRLRLRLMLSEEEVAVIDARFTHRLPPRTAAVRELLKRGLAISIPPSAGGVKSSRYRVICGGLPMHLGLVNSKRL